MRVEQTKTDEHIVYLDGQYPKHSVASMWEVDGVLHVYFSDPVVMATSEDDLCTEDVREREELLRLFGKAN
jgi:hypothetical protein